MMREEASIFRGDGRGQERRRDFPQRAALRIAALFGEQHAERLAGAIDEFRARRRRGFQRRWEGRETQRDLEAREQNQRRSKATEPGLSLHRALLSSVLPSPSPK